MAIEDGCGSTGSDAIHRGNQISLRVDAPSIKSIPLIEQFHSGDDSAPKVRKPYTITKQRERWTEDEHKKFLEALKLYGRAWRRIEEHVGTKTAVQIRSHAQKFFSKVVRESNNGDSVSVKPIEIPPPRPKRKPLHPYPRKLVSSVTYGTPAPEKTRRSLFPNTCLPGEANQSPTSVLSAFCSDAQGSADSNTTDGSPSPVSSVVGANFVGFDPCEPDWSSKVSSSPSAAQVNNSPNNGSPSAYQVNDCPTPDESTAANPKLELFPEGNAFVKEGSAEVSSTQCLKLFGKTVLVTDSCRPRSPNEVTCQMQPLNLTAGKLALTLSSDSNPLELTLRDSKYSRTALPTGAHPAVYSLPLPSGSAPITDVCYSHSLPWWTYQGGHPSFTIVQVHSPIPIKATPLHDNKEVQMTEALMHGSSPESKNVEVEVQCCRLSVGWEGKEQREQSSGDFSYKKVSSIKCKKGFVPYKRCLGDRGTQSAATGEEREEQRIRLCL